jgi:hypothetical protein
VNCEISILYDLLLGTLQGYIHGLVLYSIFVSPFADMAFLLTFAYGNYIPRFNIWVEDLIIEIENFLESITQWLRHSGLSVNKTTNQTMSIFQG